MARPLRIEYAGAYYHITARGNERREIFLNDQDREKFLSYLETANQRYGAGIHIYCLMSNHYHLLLGTPLGNLSQIMRHINGAYTNYFNAKRHRAGHLLQGRYKAIVVDVDEYAGELSRYIHLNPVRAGMTNEPEEYRWSSYQYYAGKGKPPKWLTIEFILGYFGGRTAIARKKYRDFVYALMGEEYESPLKKAVAGTLLGGKEFIDEIKEKYLKGKEWDRNLPALTEMKKLSITEIIKEAGEVFAKGSDIGKKAALYICHNYSGRSLKEIGNHFKIGESAVSQASRRFQRIVEGDGTIRKKVKHLCNKLNLCNV